MEFEKAFNIVMKVERKRLELERKGFVGVTVDEDSFIHAKRIANFNRVQELGLIEDAIKCLTDEY